MTLQTITVKEYLTRKGIIFRESGKELITHCLFNGCDDDSRGNEAHLYFNTDTGQYDCKKCGAQGNIFTLAKHFGDSIQEIALNPAPPARNRQKSTKFDAELVETCYLALPAHIRQYLNARGVSGAVIDAYKLGWGKFYGKWWITIPIPDFYGAFCFFKLRQDPNAGDDKITYPKGVEAQIYGWDLLPNTTDKLVICEGELDRLALLSKNIPAITSTHGAMTFKQEWCEKVGKGRKIYICYDNDDAGKKGAEKVAKMVESGGNETYIITLPQEVGDGGDITEYLVKLNGNTDDLFEKYAKGYPSNKFPFAKAPTNQVSFEKWRSAIQEHFPELWSPAEACASVMFQLLINDIHNPFGLVLVDVPASGKTITLNFFAGLAELVHTTDKFTPASFVSHAVNVKAEKLAQIDLLPKIKNRVLLVRELASIFSDREEDLSKNIGILTRVFDGEGLQTDSGVHGQRGYQGDFCFMFLAASTPIAPRVWKVMGNFGPRLLFFQINSKEKSEEALVLQLKAANWKQKEKECRALTSNFIRTIFGRYSAGIDWSKDKDDDGALKIIGRCAKLLAHLRAPINVWKDGTSDDALDHTVPVKEMPDRLNQLLYNLAKGHAVICDRTYIKLEDLRIVIEVTFSSAPPKRVITFKALLENTGVLTTNQTMAALNCSRPTALKELKALATLGIVDASDDGDEAEDLERHVKLKEKFHWFLSDECKQLLGLYTSPHANETQGQFSFIDEGDKAKTSLYRNPYSEP